MHFYSPSSGGFFSSATHHEDIPSDAVEITSAEHASLLAGIAGGQQIVIAANRRPALKQREVNLDEVERGWRDTELSRIRWLLERHRDEQDLGITPTLSDGRFAELLTYIQQLRDWPQSDAFPSQTARPNAPDWLVSL